MSLRCEFLEDRTLPSGFNVLGAGLAMDPTSYSSSDILVRFRTSDAAGVTMASSLSVVAAPGTVIDQSTKLVPGLDRVRLNAGTSVEAALAAYRANPNVLYAEPDYRVHLQLTPNDPQYASQWDMNNTGQTGGTPDDDIDAPEAWDISTGSGNMIVAVIDTGVDYRHPDLAANIWTNTAELNGRPNVDDDGDGYVD